MSQISRNGISLATRFEVVPKATLKHLGENEGGVLLKLDSGEMFTVNDTTVALLGELNGSNSLSDIAKRLSETFDVEMATLESDLVEIADDLMDQQLIRKV